MPEQELAGVRGRGGRSRGRRVSRIRGGVEAAGRRRAGAARRRRGAAGRAAGRRRAAAERRPAAARWQLRPLEPEGTAARRGEGAGRRRAKTRAAGASRGLGRPAAAAVAPATCRRASGLRRRRRTRPAGSDNVRPARGISRVSWGGRDPKNGGSIYRHKWSYEGPNEVRFSATRS